MSATYQNWKKGESKRVSKVDNISNVSHQESSRTGIALVQAIWPVDECAVERTA